MIILPPVVNNSSSIPSNKLSTLQRISCSDRTSWTSRTKSWQRLTSRSVQTSTLCTKTWSQRSKRVAKWSWNSSNRCLRASLQRRHSHRYHLKSQCSSQVSSSKPCLLQHLPRLWSTSRHLHLNKSAQRGRPQRRRNLERVRMKRVKSTSIMRRMMKVTRMPTFEDTTHFTVRLLAY